MRKRMKYKHVETRTLAGLKRAEWYHTHGWRTVRSGLFYILFERRES